MFELVDYETLRLAAAKWMLQTARTAPQPQSEAAAEYRMSFRLPETPFTLTQSYAGSAGEILLHFKTEIRLAAWRTRSGKAEAVFVYDKVLCAAPENPDEQRLRGYVLWR